MEIQKKNFDEALIYLNITKTTL